MPMVTTDPAVERLQKLLFSLPAELRLTIYEFCLPCMWHRHRKILLDHLGDSRWMGISPIIFADAAPLILSKPVLLAFTKLSPWETFSASFTTVIERTFPETPRKALLLARPLVQRLAITICIPTFYQDAASFGDRIAAYFSGLSLFTSLTTIYISLGPEWLPARRELFDHCVAMYDNYVPWDDARSLTYMKTIHILGAAVNALKAKIPKGCEVRWRFDRAGMPGVPSYIVDRSEVVQHLDNVNCLMAKLWEANGQQVVV